MQQDALYGSFKAELAVACRLARAAGAAIMAVYRSDFAVRYKDQDTSNPVTDADTQANTLIVQGLRAAFPNDGVLAEETAETPEATAHRRAASRLWCVDPVDGTREFVARNGNFVVMIGLAIQGRAAVGVLYQPTEDRLYWGAEAQAYVQDASGTRSLRVSDLTDPKEATFAISRTHRSRMVSQVSQLLGTDRSLPLGSVGLKMARLCEAQADLYVSMSDKTHEWDACGPEALLRAAGGEVTDVYGAPLAYNKDHTNTATGIVASNGHLHGHCLQALKTACEAWKLT
jgi:3'(2'), 5'-bisphosphate nucleotidase